MSAPSPSRLFATLNDHRECRAAIRVGSRSFFAASRLLPAHVRRPAFALYAFCRLSDDVVDLEGGSAPALARLNQRLQRAHRGQPFPNAADRALAETLRTHAIPLEVPEALLEGLAWDAQGRRYQTLEDLNGYAARVAGTVGVMMTLIMGVRDNHALARACDLGAAMQLTNIARDVGEDARAGRLYLPLDWLEEAGVDVARFLADPEPTPAIRLVVARLLDEARRLYETARAGVAELPRACRPAILAAATIYAEIGREVAAAGFDSVTRRARVSGARKLSLLAQAVATAPLITRTPPAPPTCANAFLVEAVEAHPLRPYPRARGFSALAAPFVRTLDLFERLERAEILD
jgi:phytoene synthase